MTEVIWSERLTFIHDPGHGWLKVPMTEIDALGIRKDISPYSYSIMGFAYLEEDMDYGTYMKARQEQGIPDPIITSQYVDYFDRNRASFR